LSRQHFRISAYGAVIVVLLLHDIDTDIDTDIDIDINIGIDEPAELSSVFCVALFKFTPFVIHAVAIITPVGEDVPVPATAFRVRFINVDSHIAPAYWQARSL
jgi:hypothetical protein